MTERCLKSPTALGGMHQPVPDPFDARCCEVEELLVWSIAAQRTLGRSSGWFPVGTEVVSLRQIRPGVVAVGEEGAGEVNVALGIEELLDDLCARGVIEIQEAPQC